MPLLPIFEVPSGPVDGTNRFFTTSNAYVPDSVVVFLDGQAKRRDWDDGWDELGGNKVLLDRAPKTGSIVQVYYLLGG